MARKLSNLPPLVLGILGLALVSLAAQATLEIPLSPVPVTLQTLAVMLVAGIAGPRSAALSMLAYLAAGALGAPVFADGGSGVDILLGPTGGFLWAFPVAAWSVGQGLQRSRGPWSRGAVIIAGHMGIMALGCLGLLAFGREPADISRLVLQLAPGCIVKSGTALLLLELAGFRGTRRSRSR